MRDTSHISNGDFVQRLLLESEGVPFDHRGRIDLSRYGWMENVDSSDGL